MPTDASLPLKLYFDTHIAKAVAVQLRLKGVDVVRCEEVGMAEASDLEHLEYATAEGRALVSMDKHFPKWHQRWQAEGKIHAGIFRVQAHLQSDEGIGATVRQLFEYYLLIETGAGTIEVDIINQLYFIG